MSYTSCAKMDTTRSHAWGGVHAKAWEVEGIYEQSVVVNGNAYRASENHERSSDWHASSGTGAQRFDYSFILSHAAALDPFDESGKSGLVVTLTFPTPVIITAIYGGFGATLDETALPRSWGKAGASREQIFFLCSGGNRYTGECPSVVTGAGSQGAQRTLNIQGERHTPLTKDETQSSLMAVNVACESTMEHMKAQMRKEIRPPPPPRPTPVFSPPPLPSPPYQYYYAANDQLEDDDWSSKMAESESNVAGAEEEDDDAYDGHGLSIAAATARAETMRLSASAPAGTAAAHDRTTNDDDDTTAADDIDEARLEQELALAAGYHRKPPSSFDAAASRLERSSSLGSTTSRSGLQRYLEWRHALLGSSLGQMMMVAVLAAALFALLRVFKRQQQPTAGAFRAVSASAIDDVDADDIVHETDGDAQSVEDAVGREAAPMRTAQETYSVGRSRRADVKSARPHEAGGPRSGALDAGMLD